MLTLETFAESDVQKLVSKSALVKAYSLRNRVLNPERIGDTLLSAQVNGNLLYDVEIEFAAGKVNATCTCPYTYDGYCKHIGAVMLRWLSAPQLFIAKAAQNIIQANDGPYPIRVFAIQPPMTSTPKTLPAWLNKSFQNRLEEEQKETSNALNLHRLEDLRQLAKERGWVVKGTRKSDVIEQILSQMSNLGQNIKALTKLDDEHKRALRAVALLGEFATIQPEDFERLARHWGTLKQFSKFTTYLTHLANAGLIIYAEEYRYYGMKLAWLPRSAARYFPPLLEETLPQTEELPVQSTAADIQFANTQLLMQAAFQLLLLLEQTPTTLRAPMPRPHLERTYRSLEAWDYLPSELLPLEKSGKQRGYQELWLTVPPPEPALPDEAQNRLLPLTGDATYLEFLFALLLEAGLFQPGSPITVWPKVKEEFLRQGMDTQRAVLIRTYFNLQGWSELWPVLRTQPTLQLVRNWNTYGAAATPQSLDADLANFRRLVLTTLAWLPDNRWVRLDELLKLLRAVWPQFDQGMWSPYGRTPNVAWRLTTQGQPLEKNNMEAWRLAQGNFILTMLQGPLSWLGLVDLALSNGIVTHLRLHGLADLFYDRVETIAPASHPAATPATPIAAPVKPAADAITVTDDAIQVNPALISAQAHSLLDRMARLEVAQPQHFVYRLEANAVHQTFERGATLDDLLSEWQQQIRTSVPTAIEQRLRQWWEAYGRVRLYQDVTLIEFGDDYALTEMKAVTTLNKVMIAEISPRLVLIPKPAAKDLIAELEKAGYTPRQADKDT